MMVSGRHLFDRRTFLNDLGYGLSGIALAQLLGDAGLLASEKTSLRPVIDPANPNAPRPPHFPAKAKTSWSSFAPALAVKSIRSITNRS